MALVWDISKAFHSIHASEMDKLLRLIVWGLGKLEKNWSTWGFDRIAFGDVPSSVFLELVQELTGLLGIKIDALTAKKVAADGHADDEMIGENRMVEGK